LTPGRRGRHDPHAASRAVVGLGPGVPLSRRPRRSARRAFRTEALRVAQAGDPGHEAATFCPRPCPKPARGAAGSVWRPTPATHRTGQIVAHFRGRSSPPGTGWVSGGSSRKTGCTVQFKTRTRDVGGASGGQSVSSSGPEAVAAGRRGPGPLVFLSRPSTRSGGSASSPDAGGQAVEPADRARDRAFVAASDQKTSPARTACTGDPGPRATPRRVETARRRAQEPLRTEWAKPVERKFKAWRGQTVS